MFDAIVAYDVMTFLKLKRVRQPKWVTPVEMGRFADRLNAYIRSLGGQPLASTQLEVARREFFTMGQALEFKLIAEDDEFSVEIKEIA